MKILLFLLVSITFASRAQKKPVEGDVAISVTHKKDSVLPNGVHQQTISGAIKRALFYDEKGTRITKDKFYGSIDHKINIEGFTETDTVVSYKLYTRRNYAKISADNRKIILDYLGEISEKQDDSTAITIVHFYSGLLGEPSDLLTHRVDLKRCVKKAPKDVKVQQYLVYRQVDGPNAPKAGKLGWVHDKEALIENTFTPTHFNYGSFIIIMPNGQCYTYFGEYETERVSEGLLSLIEKDKR